MRFAHVLAALVALALAALPARAADKRWIEVTVVADVPSWFVLYADTGRGFREEDSSRAPYVATTFGGVRLHLDLPEGPVRALRLDPALGRADIRLSDWSLHSADAPPLPLAPGGVAMLQQVEIVGWEGATLALRVPEGADDPMLLLADPAWLRVLRDDGPRRGAVLGMFALLGAFTAVLVGAGWIALRTREHGRAAWPVLVGVALLAWGLKLGLADSGPGGLSPLPFWDAWDGEISGVAEPLASGTLDPAAWFRPHNEHRIVPTRLVAGLVTFVDGAWDNRVTVAVSLLWLGLALAVLVAVPAGCGDRTAAAACAVVVLAFAAGAADWENTVSGFQGQFHAALLFSVLAFAVVARARPGFATGACVAATVLAAMLSMGAGLPAALAALVGAGIAWRSERGGMYGPSGQRHLTLLTILVPVLVAGTFLRTRVPGHDALRADGLGGIAEALLHYGTWPFPAHPVALVLLWLPSAALLGHALWRGEPRASHRFLLMLAAYGFGLCLALAESRAATLPHISSRYTTSLALGLVANAGCAACILRLLLPHAAHRPWRAGAALAFAAVCAAAVLHRSAWHGHPAAEGYGAASARRTALLLRHAAEPDAGVLRTAAPEDLAYPDRTRLGELTRDPAVVAVLPAAYRRATGRYPDAGDGIAAHAARFLLHHHLALVALGAGLLGWCVACLGRPCTSEPDDDPGP